MVERRHAIVQCIPTQLDTDTGGSLISALFTTPLFVQSSFTLKLQHASLKNEGGKVGPARVF